jgi:hypothetical protein
MPMAKSADTSDAGNDDRKRTLRNLLYFLMGVALVELALLVAAVQDGVVAAVGVCGTIFVASGGVGAFLGFLFAVPRVLARGAEPETSTAEDKSVTQDKGQSAKEVDARPSNAKRLRRMLQTNTNLERISDWLTTMLVGVGLSQIGNIGKGLTAFGDSLAERARVFGGSHAGATSISPNAGMIPLIGPMLLVIGLIVGFFLLYLSTRLVLATLFNKVEQDLEAPLGDPGQAPVDDPTAKAAVNSAAGSLATDSENPAFRTVPVGETPSVDQSIAVMFNLLYRPGGYQEVIDLGGKLAITPATKKPEYWFYLAAAFGQKHKDLKRNKAPANELKSARVNALDCARRAVELDPAYRARLWSISKSSGIDDDLSDFRNDATFRDIVGVPMAGPDLRTV